jgi:hypothetical protein
MRFCASVAAPIFTLLACCVARDDIRKTHTSLTRSASPSCRSLRLRHTTRTRIPKVAPRTRHLVHCASLSSCAPADITHRSVAVRTRVPNPHPFSAARSPRGSPRFRSPQSLPHPIPLVKGKMWWDDLPVRCTGISEESNTLQADGHHNTIAITCQVPTSPVQRPLEIVSIIQQYPRSHQAGIRGKFQGEK